MPYTSRQSDTIARLLLASGQSRADAERRRGDIWGSAVANVGQQAGSSLRDMVFYTADEPRRRKQALDLQESERVSRGREVLRSLTSRLTDQETGRLDVPTMTKELRSAGYPEIADTVTTKYRAEQDRVLGDLRERVTAHRTAFGQGAQLLREVEAQPELYPRIRPMLVELAGGLDPRLASEIPESYDSERLRGMLQFTMAGAQEAETRGRALARMERANKVTDDALKRKKLHRESVAEWLSTAKSEEDWTASVENAIDMGIDRDVVDAFGAWSKDAPARAARILMTPEQRATADKTTLPTAGSKEDIYQSYATEKFGGRPWRTMSATQKTAAEKWWTERTRVKDPGTPKKTDDPELPRGVVDYIDTLRRKTSPETGQPYTFEDAQQDLARTWEDLRRDHPRLDVVKADNALRSLFRPPPRVWV